MEGWGAFVEDMRQFYGMDLDCLSQVRDMLPFLLAVGRMRQSFHLRCLRPEVPVNKYAALAGSCVYCAHTRRDACDILQAYQEEQREYYISTAAWSDVHPSQLVGPPTRMQEYDLLKVTVAELEAPLKVRNLLMFDFWAPPWISKPLALRRHALTVSVLATWSRPPSCCFRLGSRLACCVAAK